MTNTTRSSHETHLMNWCIWKVLVPFLIVVALWPMYRLIGRDPDAFTKAFEHGDLLIFAALLFIEVALEAAEAKNRSSPSQDWRLELAKALTVLVMFMFGAIKLDTLMNEHDKSKMLAYASLSVTAAILAVVVTMWSLYKSIYLSASEELKTAGADAE